MAGVGRINAVGLLYNSFIYSRMKEITYIFSGSQGFSDEGRTDFEYGRICYVYVRGNCDLSTENPGRG